MSWKLVRLRDLGHWVGGGTPSKSRPEFWSAGTVPWLSPKDMGVDVLAGTQDRITEAAVQGSAVRRVPPGSVAVVVRSGILERTLPVALVPFETTLNQDMKALIPREGVDPRWVAWGLRSMEQGVLRNASKAGTTVASIEFPRFLNLEIPLAELPVQRRVIAILEEHLSDITAGLSYLAAARSRVEHLQESLLGELVRDPSASTAALSTLTAIPLSNGRSVRTREGGFPVLRLTAMRAGRVDLRQRKSGDWSAIEAYQFLVKRGDFMVARGNGTLRLVGRGALVDDNPDNVAFPDTMIRVRPNTELIDPQWLAFAWNSRFVREQIERDARTSAGIYKVNQAGLNQIQVPLLPMERQRSAATALLSGEADSQRCKRAIDLATLRGSVLRHAVLAAAFSGGLSGRAYDTKFIENLVNEESVNEMASITEAQR